MARDLQKPIALGAGVLLTLLGAAGFFSGSSVLGLGTNPLHNGVHLFSGLLGLLAFWQGWSMTYNRVFGIFYLLVALLGFVAFGFMLQVLNVNTAVNLLHLVLGTILAAVGFAPQIARGSRTARP